MSAVARVYLAPSNGPVSGTSEHERRQVAAALGGVGMHDAGLGDGCQPELEQNVARLARDVTGAHKEVGLHL